VRTLIENPGHRRLFGYVPPHGVFLARHGHVVIDGDLRTVLAGGKRYSRGRELAALRGDEEAGQVRLDKEPDPSTSSSSSPSFSPRDLPGIVAWYDALQLTRGRGSPPSESSSSSPSSSESSGSSEEPVYVPVWPELIHGRDAEAPMDLSHQPIYVPDGINGQPVIAFSNDRWFTVPYAAALNPAALSLFAVVKKTRGGDTWDVWYSENSGGYDLFIDYPRAIKARQLKRGRVRHRDRKPPTERLPSAPSVCAQVRVGDEWIEMSYETIETDPTVIGMTIDAVNPMVIIWAKYHGLSFLLDAPYTPNDSDDVWIGGYGNSGDPGLYIGEIVLTEGVMAPADRANLHEYFKAKWGLVW